ncbi:MAG: response regulator [Ginsengibacter sp.]
MTKPDNNHSEFFPEAVAAKEDKHKKPYLHASNDIPDKCILIYDDEPEILFLCKVILSNSPYRVETLLRCDNVINDIARIQPDIILMDLSIPEIGGEKAINIIKANPATQHIPIIIVSANREIKEIYKKTKAEDYIEKPFNMAYLKETIAKTLLKIKSVSGI